MDGWKDGWTDRQKKRGWLFASSVPQELSPSQSISYMHLVPSKQTDTHPKAEIRSDLPSCILPHPNLQFPKECASRF